MREIKFRGKRADIGEWIYGYVRQAGHENIEKANGQYIKTVKYYQIQDDKYHSQFIDENTLGQCTGLKDKNGKEIYEGDILQIDTDRAYIKWDDKYGYFQLIPIGDYYFDSDVIGHALEYVDVEVIGNIYDNPELLSEKE